MSSTYQNRHLCSRYLLRDDEAQKTGAGYRTDEKRDASQWKDDMRWMSAGQKIVQT
jgi:hypothetical protein